MKKNILYTIMVSALLFAGCDYNEDNFEGFDDTPISNLTKFEGDYTGDYPAAGYFTTKEEVQTSVNKMLAKLYTASDKGSTAKVNVLYGDVTPGITDPTANEVYKLTSEDYDSMGTADGQPGKFNNFDSKMDVAKYLSDFCKVKYASAADATIVKITYVYYSGGTSDKDMFLKKSGNEWVELLAFSPDKSYTLQKDDYDAMGTESGYPGKYDNFDSNMDPDFFLPRYLSIKYMYEKEGTVIEIIYKYYADKVTTNKSKIYKLENDAWKPFDPKADVVELSTKIAEMTYNGTTWILDRLVGGSTTITMDKPQYQLLLDWSTENKPAYKSTKYDNEEYYFGVSTYYPNVNNVYNTWKRYYNIDNEYDNLTDEQLQVIMDERLAWGIAHLVLPAVVTEPDSGLSYAVVYTIYGGRGNGDYSMSFMYNEEKAEFEKVAGPSAL